MRGDAKQDVIDTPHMQVINSGRLMPLCAVTRLFNFTRARVIAKLYCVRDTKEVA